MDRIEPGIPTSAPPQFGRLAFQLFRIKPECLGLLAPLGGWITESLNTDAAGQAAFHGCFDKIGREEGKRDGHVDLPNAALLAHAKLCDRGYTDTADTIIKHIEENCGTHYFIHHMVLSHADNDHATGLVGVLKHFKVMNLWMNRPWLYAADILPHVHGKYELPGLIKKIRDMHPYLVELEEIAISKGTTVHDVFQGDLIGPFTVLAPSRERYINLLPDLDKTPTSYRDSAADSQPGGFLKGLVEAAKKWLDETWDVETLSNSPEPTSASNETCVVQHGIIEGESILLTADVGPNGLNEAADYAESLGLLKPPKFVQVPHHGSRRNVTPSVLDRWLGGRMAKGEKYGNAFCSVGKDKPEYPRGQVKNAFERRGYPVHATRGVPKTHFHGRKLRDGWKSSIPEPFDDKVEV